VPNSNIETIPAEIRPVTEIRAEVKEKRKDGDGWTLPNHLREATSQHPRVQKEAETSDDDEVDRFHRLHVVNTKSPAPYTVSPDLLVRERRLFIVAFKCARASIYYLPEDTSLDIQHGDLVIVEADRGQDLGQVTHVDVTAEEAVRLRSDADHEHYRWLVMFSQYSAAGNTSEFDMRGALSRTIGLQEQSEFRRAGTNYMLVKKPKTIKRLAEVQEVSDLRDKEAQEAKAKRVAMKKVAEYQLPMEILDAEFQA
jgi:hypothetical protein